MKIINMRSFGGVALGGACVIGLGLVVFLGFKVGNRVIDYFDIENKREKIDYRPLKHDFKIGFEEDVQAKMFDAKMASRETTEEWASEGERSLKVEFPSGREFPGIAMEVYGRSCFDWSDMGDFSFVVFNAIDAPAHLSMKIRSGSDYPKKTFETGWDIPPKKVVKITIPRKELQDVLDLGSVSGISFFMQDPRTSYIFYFDDLKVTRK